MLVPFASRTRSATSLAVDTQRLINCYPEYQGQGKGKSVAALYGVPGLSLFGNFGGNPCRGWLQFGDHVYAVFRNELLRIDAGAASTVLGQLATSSGRVGIADNGDDIAVADGVGGYSYIVSSGTFSTIGGAFPAGATHLAYLDGFMVAAPQTANPQRFYVSDSKDVTSWSAIQFASAERQDDNLVGVISDHADLFLFGAATTEIWNSAGGGLFPFARLSGISLQWGLAAPRAATKFRDSIAFLARRSHDGALRVIGMEGYSPVPLSNEHIEAKLREYSSVTDAVASSYSLGGHDFLQLHFATAGVCWCYDAQTREWHERRYGPSAVGRAVEYLQFNGLTLAADYSNGNVYTVERGVFDDNGEELHFAARGEIVADSERRIGHAALEAVWNRAVGTQTGQGRDPQAELRISDDGGRTWTGGLFRSMGKAGETRARTIWRRLGRPRNRVYELRVTDPVERVLVGAVLEVS